MTDFFDQQDDGDEYIIVGEYIDDGVSGTTDEERPDFQRLLTDIRKGKINCVVVKNLARSFRNNGDQSYYLGDWFPRNDVRFISLYQQPIDTYKDPQNAQNIAVPVQGVLNEEHARGTSESVRRTLVDTIKVYENGNISVELKFANEYRRVAEYIEVNTHSNAV